MGSGTTLKSNEIEYISSQNKRILLKVTTKKLIGGFIGPLMRVG